MRPVLAIPIRVIWHYLIVAVAAAAAVSAAIASWADEFTPYRARVIAPSAAVHSGPGEKFYTTDTLAEGDAVEVYREHAGWCAIRPPEGSFSWIFGRQLRFLDRSDPNNPPNVQLAEIEKSEVPSRIGSRTTSENNAVQIRLKKGEVVQVLGVVRTGDGDELNYKIAPPAGEFRWVQTAAIERTGPVSGHEIHSKSQDPQDAGPSTVSNAVELAPLTALPESAPKVSEPIATVSDTSAGSSPITPIAASPPGDDWRAALDKTPGGSIAAPPLAMPTASPVASPLASAPTALPKQDATTTAIPATNNTANNTSNAQAPLQSNASERSARLLTNLELRLSRMVAEPPVSWNTAPLKAEGEGLLAQAQSPADRTAIQATLAKIDRFAAIERRSRGTAGGTAGAAPTGNGEFDAVGVLRPVASRRPGAPPFALVDDRGQVLSFVSPAPGVNLAPYLGQRIGVNGNRGFIPEFQRLHVAAGRVSPVADRMIR